MAGGDARHMHTEDGWRVASRDARDARTEELPDCPGLTPDRPGLEIWGRDNSPPLRKSRPEI